MKQKLNITLDKELIMQTKMAAILQNTSASKLITAALQEYFTNHKTKEVKQ